MNNANAVAALKEAKSWIGTIAPEGVPGYKEEESRGVWQLGNAVFMRNWPYAYALGNGDDSPIKGKFAVSALPSRGDGFTPAATLGGWNVAVSKYSPHKEAAIKLALYLGSPEFQKGFAVSLAHLPTIASVYDDPDVAAAQPIVAKWKNVVLNAVPRPSAPTKDKYNEVSSDFWTAVRNTMSGPGVRGRQSRDSRGSVDQIERRGLVGDSGASDPIAADLVVRKPRTPRRPRSN